MGREWHQLYVQFSQARYSYSEKVLMRLSAADVYSSAVRVGCRADVSNLSLWNTRHAVKYTVLCGFGHGRKSTSTNTCKMTAYNFKWPWPRSYTTDTRSETPFYLSPTNHTCLYSPAARRHRSFGGSDCAYSRRDGQAELIWAADYIPRWMFRTDNWTRTQSSIPVLTGPDVG